MTDLDALLAGIVADPHNAVRWLILADWLDDHDQPNRAELLRLHRKLIDTCLEPDAHPDRGEWLERLVELIDGGVTPCVPQDTLTLPGGLSLVGSFIPPGSFLMGGEIEANEQPVHQVTLTRGFFLGVHPITRAQWWAVMGGELAEVNRPVEGVTWDDAVNFCERASQLTKRAVRLPTEAEWEYACRAGTTGHYHYGDVDSTFRMNYRGSDVVRRHGTRAYRATAIPVGSLPANPWGLFDCHGNVSEWCRDGYAGGYSPATVSDPVREPTAAPDFPEGTVDLDDFVPPGGRVLRGGNWHDDPSACRSASRAEGYPGVSRTGFRAAWDLG